MARPSKHDGIIKRRNDSKVWWMRYRDRDGSRRIESTHTEDLHRDNQQLRERLQARDNNTLHVVRKGERIVSREWSSQPLIRTKSTHVANMNALKTLLPVFGDMKLSDIEATQIEVHLRSQLKQRKKVHRTGGTVLLGTLKPATVHQEFRILRRIFSVAVKKKLCQANPCDGVDSR